MIWIGNLDSINPSNDNLKEEIKSPGRFIKKQESIDESDSVSNSVSDSGDDKRNIYRQSWI